MTTVVFTGRGLTRGGTHLTRDEWAGLARGRGYAVMDKVDWGVNLLVASRTDTTKAQAARRYGTEVVTYAQFESLLAGTLAQASSGAIVAPAPEPVQPVAAPGPFSQTEIEDAYNVWQAVACKGGPLAGDIDLIEMARKPGHFDNIKEAVPYATIATLRNVPSLRVDQVYPHGTDCITPYTEFRDSFALTCDNHQVYVFMLNVGGRLYLVNTEGYNYCRYVARVEGLPFDAPEVPEPAMVRPRRAIRL